MNSSHADRWKTYPPRLDGLNDDDSQVRQRAWESFVSFYERVIAGFARNRGIRPQDRDDVVQEVLLNFFKAASEFKYDPRKGRFRGYLKTVTCRVIDKSAKRLGRSSPLTSQMLETLEAGADRIDESWESNWEEQLLREASRRVKKSCARSVPRERTYMAFEQYCLKGKPAGEVAQSLGLTENGVYAAASRIKKRVRAVVKQLESEQERHFSSCFESATR